MPKVSIIIPTYNRSALLKAAIDSVLLQTYSNYEIVIVDDGSTDNTAQLIESYAIENIRYCYQKNKGRSAARNHGIELAKGDYIAFLDSDDTFLPQKLELQVSFLDNNPLISFVYAHAKNVDENGNYLSYHFEGNLSGWIYPDLLFIRNNFITTPTVMVRAHVLAEIGGFDESMHICEDLDLWRRIARNHQVVQIAQPLALIRIRASEQVGIMEFVKARTSYYEKAFSEDLSLLDIRKGLYAELYWTCLEFFFYYDMSSSAICSFIKLCLIDLSTGCCNESSNYPERIMELYKEVVARKEKERSLLVTSS